jgi:hypothetical protein
LSPPKRKHRKPTPREVFVSHSSKNSVFTERLVRTLNRYDIRHFYSKKNILGAQQWHDEIGAALARCDWFLLVLSPESVKSEWVKSELLYALRSKRFKERIVPLIHKACDQDKLSWTLAALQYIDFRQSFHGGCTELFALWGIRYSP